MSNEPKIMTPEERAAFIDNLPAILDQMAADLLKLNGYAHVHTADGVMTIERYEKRKAEGE